ncbi:trifunctional dihydropteroate synthetase [Batrachochytrium dendrobatidis]|nr:trifunctional dihydropteroate synthetase [Batrachochytrium dendrobatidis]KAK5666473.1 trifunctional dihydropteroate synthetase [Batrachochytrium dendrobatidis]
MDKLIVKDLAVRNITGVDSWERSKQQPLIITVVGYTDVGLGGMHDLLSESVSYSAISKEAQKFAESSVFRSLEKLAAGIVYACLTKFPLECVSVKVLKPRALLHATSAGVELVRTKSDIPRLSQLLFNDQNAALSIADSIQKESQPNPETVAADPYRRADILSINDLVLNCIIGVNAWEREERQNIIVNIQMFVELDDQALIADHVPKMQNYRTITRMLTKLVEESSYKTVEALAIRIAHLLIQVCFVPKVTIRIEKPSALTFAASAGVEITRTRSSLLNETHVPISLKDSASNAVVFLAIGSNLGDRAQNIHKALDCLINSEISIADTSFLYETSPMYITDQPLFLNCCIKIKTCLSPHDLLCLLKKIEADLGRDLHGGVCNGPRPIDLDILFYNQLELNSETLVIPHPRITERAFVLRPLCDIAPDMEHVGKFRTIRQELALLKHEESDDCIWKVMPVRGSVWRVDERTRIMGVLNVTPDSFSDGNKFMNVESAVSHSLKMVDENVDIIDVGGHSTNPGSDATCESDELERVTTSIRAIRKHNSSVPISVDTFRASIATAAIEAGADFINDISGGSKDPDMLKVMAASHLPVCLMHMRGDSKTMMSLTDYAGDVIGAIHSSMTDLVQAAIKAGVYRWNIMIDPGIGFAKTMDQNYEILKRLPDIAKPNTALEGFPILVGPSRKRFIGETLQENDPTKRGWGTAAACSAAVAGGASVMRVHDIKEMRDVILVADKCFRM